MSESVFNTAGKSDSFQLLLQKFVLIILLISSRNSTLWVSLNQNQQSDQSHSSSNSLFWIVNYFKRFDSNHWFLCKSVYWPIISHRTTDRRHKTEMAKSNYNQQEEKIQLLTFLIKWENLNSASSHLKKEIILCSPAAEDKMNLVCLCIMYLIIFSSWERMWDESISVLPTIWILVCLLVCVNVL